MILKFICDSKPIRIIVVMYEFVNCKWSVWFVVKTNLMLCQGLICLIIFLKTKIFKC